MHTHTVDPEVLGDAYDDLRDFRLLETLGERAKRTLCRIASFERDPTTSLADVVVVDLIALAAEGLLVATNDGGSLTVQLTDAGRRFASTFVVD